MPAEFTSARSARAARARRDGNRELERALQRLRKPTTAAWLANVLVRERPKEVAQLIGLGAALRKAQAAFEGDTLRRLSGRRQELVQGLVRHAEELADERGQRVSDAALRELEETLEAALFDEPAAGQLQQGRLTGALAYSGIGFPTPDVEAPDRTPAADLGRAGCRTPAGRSPQAAPQRSGGKRAATASELHEAQRAARDARNAADRAASGLSAAERVLERERTAVSAAEAELAGRRDRARSAQREVARARSDRDAAEKEARKLEGRVEAIRPTRS